LFIGISASGIIDKVHIGFFSYAAKAVVAPMPIKAVRLITAAT
jgi:hypothetical protein